MNKNKDLKYGFYLKLSKEDDEFMVDISKECVITNKDPNTSNQYFVGYSCKNCGYITTSPKPVSINGWIAKGDKYEVKLFCPTCSKSVR